MHSPRRSLNLAYPTAAACRWRPGPAGAAALLDKFLARRLSGFVHDSAKVDRDSTSQLSPWLHAGSISVRHIYSRVRARQAEWAARGEDHTASCLDFLQQARAWMVAGLGCSLWCSRNLQS